MKKKVFSVLLTVALATGVLAGCGSSAATGNNAATGAAQNEGSQTASATTAGEESGDTIVIRSCFATGMTGAVNRFAIEKGLYKELGIEFENVEASADTNSTVMSLITRGEIDVADGDPSSYIPGIYNGVPAKLVGNMWRYSGCYWLVANNDIQDFSDLEGKKVGTAGASGGMRLSVLKMLEKNGVSTDNVDLIANGVYQTAYASLTSGKWTLRSFTTRMRHWLRQTAPDISWEEPGTTSPTTIPERSSQATALLKMSRRSCSAS